jgi:hypothetical protein
MEGNKKRIEVVEKKGQMGYLFVIIIRSSQKKGDKMGLISAR